MTNEMLMVEAMRRNHDGKKELTHSIDGCFDYPDCGIVRTVTDDLRLELSIIDKYGHETVINNDCPQTQIMGNKLFDALWSSRSSIRIMNEDVQYWVAYHCKMHGIQNDFVAQMCGLEYRPAQVEPEEFGIRNVVVPEKLNVIVPEACAISEYIQANFSDETGIIVIEPESITLYMTAADSDGECIHFPRTAFGMASIKAHTEGDTKAWLILNYIGRDTSGSYHYIAVTDGYVTAGEKLLKNE